MWCNQVSCEGLSCLCILNVSRQMSSAIIDHFMLSPLYYKHSQVRGVNVLNSLNSRYNNITTVVLFLQLTNYAIIMNCNNPCTFEIKHITSSFDFDRLRKYSVHLVFVCYRSVIFKLEDVFISSVLSMSFLTSIVHYTVNHNFSCIQKFVFDDEIHVFYENTGNSPYFRYFSNKFTSSFVFDYTREINRCICELQVTYYFMVYLKMF